MKNTTQNSSRLPWMAKVLLVLMIIFGTVTVIWLIAPEGTYIDIGCYLNGGFDKNAPELHCWGDKIRQEPSTKPPSGEIPQVQKTKQPEGNAPTPTVKVSSPVSGVGDPNSSTESNKSRSGKTAPNVTAPSR